MLYFNMFERAHLKGVPNNGVIFPRDLKYLRRLYGKNKESIENYYLTRKFAVPNQHVISRFVEHMTLMLNSEFFEFLYMAEPNLEYLSESFQFTSNINKGVVHPPYFYANDGADIIISEYDHIDRARFKKDWKTYPCIRTLMHPRNDFKLLLANGKDDGSRGGVSVVAINLLALNAKYREFVREENIAYNKGISPMSKNVFVMRYVLPNMIESDIDHRFINLVMDRFYGNKMCKPRFKINTTMTEPTTQLDRYADEVVSNITTKDMDFGNIMYNIPLMFKENLAELLVFENMPSTRHSNWAYVVSRLKFMVFIYDVAYNRTRNKKTIEDWKNLVRRLEQDRAMLGEFPPKWNNEIRHYIDRIKNM